MNASITAEKDWGRVGVAVARSPMPNEVGFVGANYGCTAQE